MSERNQHSEAVKAWRETWSGTLLASARVEVYERALDALWRRAHRSLGEVTLMAIVDRVLHHGTERFPHLGVLKVEASGVHFAELRLSASALDVALLDESLAFIVIELLRVLGTLTGEILTPGLHAELGTVRPGSVDEKGGRS
jgi:hypothetical protein